MPETDQNQTDLDSIIKSLEALKAQGIDCNQIQETVWARVEEIMLDQLALKTRERVLRIKDLLAETPDTPATVSTPEETPNNPPKVQSQIPEEISAAIGGKHYVRRLLETLLTHGKSPQIASLDLLIQTMYPHRPNDPSNRLNLHGLVRTLRKILKDHNFGEIINRSKTGYEILLTEKAPQA